MRILMITNPVAGKNKGQRTANDAFCFFKNHGHQPEIVLSKWSGHAIEIAQNCNVNEWDAMIAIGGDGTLFEIINGLLKRDHKIPIPLGQIPTGTGNSFIKDLDVHSPESAYEKILGGKTKKVDIGRCKYADQQFYFINILGLGFVSDVAFKARKYKRFGDLSYIFGVFEELIQLKTHALELTIDGQTMHRKNVFVEISNSTRTGGDMIMAPAAKIDDGYLDIILLNDLSRIKLLKAFPKIFKGTHIELPEVETFQGKHIKITTDLPKRLTPDGEILGTTPIEVEVMPHKVEMFC